MDGVELLPRCQVCQVRHLPGDECAEPSEEGYISRDELMSAFRAGLCVCLACQSIWTRDGMPDGVCPDCGGPQEAFSDDDLEAQPREGV